MRDLLLTLALLALITVGDLWLARADKRRASSEERKELFLVYARQECGELEQNPPSEAQQ